MPRRNYYSVVIDLLLCVIATGVQQKVNQSGIKNLDIDQLLM